MKPTSYTDIKMFFPKPHMVKSCNKCKCFTKKPQIMFTLAKENQETKHHFRRFLSKWIDFKYECFRYV